VTRRAGQEAEKDAKHSRKKDGQGRQGKVKKGGRDDAGDKGQQEGEEGSSYNYLIFHGKKWKYASLWEYKITVIMLKDGGLPAERDLCMIYA
jgi:hypothetical protein